jgi:Putative bacterial sensory transduction regulator
MTTRSDRADSGGARSVAEATVAGYLERAEIEHEPGARPGEYVVVLPGERKLQTAVSLLVGDHSVSASAFVVRHAEERHEQVYRWLLERNARLPGIAFAVDQDGDVYLVGRLPLAAVSEDTLDALLGSILEASDGSFNELLALGFLSSIKREWAWRTSRGESTRNLEAFRHLLERD